MRLLIKTFGVAIILALSIPAASLRAADAQPSTEELLQRIDRLEKELKDLQSQVRHQAQQQQQQQPPVAPVPPIKAGAIINAG
ncbi:MAG TPA: hypothetical protein VGJ73_22405, partial [Verrucomicrobiae bacterium]